MKSLIALTVGTCLAGAVVAQQAPVSTSRLSRFVASQPQATTLAQPPANVRPALPPVAPQAPSALGIARRPGETTWVGVPLQSQQNVFFSANGRFNKELASAERNVSDATKALAAAKGDDIAEAETALEDALSELFDQKTAVREAKIEKLEKELAELRDQLDQRIDQKNRIVRLKLQTVVNEAKGLTF
ncbi:MAG: hypothetical protein NXI04_27965 [Planctomycetaceae bacterium]|nr:hypothetical protein [Planctomycetaceae bacterium]